METNTPFPGSPDALARGCRCPSMDNGYGDPQLAHDRGGWWIAGDCPIHGVVSDEKAHNEDRENH